MPDLRGSCDVCGRRFRLRRDGSVPGHPAQRGEPDRACRICHPECPGSDRPARPLRFTESGRPDCGDCLIYLCEPGRGAALAESCASVAIETGGDPGQMLRDYLTAYHLRDHKELSRDAQRTAGGSGA